MTAVTILAFVAAGCSRAVTVPTRELVPPSHWHGLYRVSTSDDVFTVSEFSVADSALVIQKLGDSDKRNGDVDLPIRLQLEDVRSVDRLETAQGKTFLVVLGGALLAAIIIGLVTWDGPAVD